MTAKTVFLEPDGLFHVYNRANGDELLFQEVQHYQEFLKKLFFYVNPIAKIHVYTLMPNHFHMLISCRPFDVLEKLYVQKLHGLKLLSYKKASPANKEIILQQFIGMQFKKLFNSYAQWYNKKQARKGSVFIRPYKRKKVETEQYKLKLVHYILSNPVEAGLCENVEKYSFSSYNTILEEAAADGNQVVTWFENVENFKYVLSRRWPAALILDDQG